MSLQTGQMEAGEHRFDPVLKAQIRAFVDAGPAPEADGSDVIFYFVLPGTVAAFGAPKDGLRESFGWACSKADEKLNDPKVPVYTRADALVAMMHWWLIQDTFDAEVGQILSTYAWSVYSLSESMHKTVPAERILYAFASVQHGAFAMGFAETPDEIAEALAMQIKGHPFFGTGRKGN